MVRKTKFFISTVLYTREGIAFSSRAGQGWKSAGEKVRKSSDPKLLQKIVTIKLYTMSNEQLLLLWPNPKFLSKFSTKKIAQDLKSCRENGTARSPIEKG